MRDLGDTEAVVTVNDHRLAAGDDLAVKQQLDGLFHMAVELNHGAGGEVEDLAQAQQPLTKAQRDIGR